MNLAELRRLWAARDKRYAMRGRRFAPVSPESESAVCVWRMAEATKLPDYGEQAIALEQAARWQPPRR
jgi:hypothetical protein